MASDHVIEEIKQRIDIVEYIGRSLELKRVGRTYKARCPFHAENTPSFVVFPQTGTWHCFGACGEGGDLFSYVQKREGLSFAETLRLLARETGVTLQEESEEAQQTRREREHLLSVCDAAAQQFQSWLRDLPEAQHCRAYIEQRQIAPETLHRFQIGYAPNAWDLLLTTLGERGYTPQDLATVGLVREREGGGYYDTFRDRLIFPIRDTRGRVIAFGGRALRNDQTPKYVNSPNTDLFDKSRTLYGLDLARDAIRTRECAVVVEGYMDVISAHQAGFTNVVAALGTALTADQIHLLSRYSPNLIFALDADVAGRRAAERGLDVALEIQKQGRRVRWERARRGQGTATDVQGDIRVLTLPPNHDPDDLIRSAPDRWEKLVAEAQPIVDYLISERLRDIDLDDPVQKARVASDLLPVVAEIESAIVRDHYLRRLARLLRTDERTLAQEIVKHRGRRGSRGTKPTPSEERQPPEAEKDALQDVPTRDHEGPLADENTPRDLEAYLLYLFFERPEFLQKSLETYPLRPDMWERTEHREIFEALIRHGPQSAAHIEEFTEELEQTVAQRVQRIVHFYAAHPAVVSEEWEKEATGGILDFLLRFELRQARKLKQLLNDLQSSDEETEASEWNQLLLQQTHLQRRILQRQQELWKLGTKRNLVELNRP